MNRVITPNKLKGKIDAVPSKSIAHRALICSALSNGESTVSNIELSEDIKATISALELLGAKIVLNSISGNRHEYSVKGIDNVDSTPDINCRESGSTLRFMIPVSLALTNKVTFNGGGLLPKRPLDVYFNIFKEQGIVHTKDEKGMPITFEGELKADTFHLAGDVSSQFITGMMLAAPKLSGTSKIIIDTPLESKGYVDLTIDVMKRFGVNVDEKEKYTQYIIDADKSYIGNKYYVEGDWSQMAFIILLGILGEGIKITGINNSSKQGDMEVVTILRRMGAKIVQEDDKIIVSPSKLKGTVIEVSQIPDLVPALAAAASIAKGTTRIINGKRLRIKESDRLQTVHDALKKMGADIRIENDGLVIEGKEALSGGKSSSFNDHRIAMMLASISSICKNDVEIIGAECINKSYPSFWQDFSKLGGIIDGK